MNALAIKTFLPKHIRENAQFMKLIDRLLGSKMEFGNCSEVPAHDMRIYPQLDWQRIEGSADGKPMVVLVGVPIKS